MISRYSFFEGRDGAVPFFALCVFALLAGAACSFGMAPYHWWPVFLAGMAGFYATLSQASGFRGGLGLGWLFGFGYFVFGLSWIGNALLVEGNDYAWAWPLAVCGLPALLAFFPALACGLAARFLDLRHWSGFFGFCALMGGSEWLRGHLFTGFPWNLYGYIWGEVLPVLQILYFSDVYFLTAFTLCLSAAGGYFLVSISRRTAFAIFLGFAVMLAGFYGAGYARLSHTPTRFHDDITLKLVQPNIAQSEKWDRQKIAQHFEKQVDMSFATGLDGDNRNTLIVWPETALHFLYLRDKGTRTYLQDMLSSYSGQAYLMTGTLLKAAEGGAYTNSIVALDKTGAIVRQYDKSRLVPFGEYIPLQSWIPLETVSRFSGFARGSGAITQSLELSGGEALLFSPLVCYEILFPHAVMDESAPPDMIINVTNDAWYGFSAGPYQHLLKARFRAVEEGVPVVRVANTGITAVFDPLGRTIIRSSLFEDAVYNARLPLKENHSLNTGAIHTLKYYGFFVFLLGLTGLGVYGLRKNTRFRK